MSDLDVLDKELEMYNHYFDSWKEDHYGEYVLIKNDKVNFYSSFEDGIRDGTRLYGQSGYLLKRIEDTHVISLG